jgi:hypothetical protein
LIRCRIVVTRADEERRRLVLDLARAHSNRSIHPEAPRRGIGLRGGQRGDWRQDWVLWREAGRPALQSRSGR